MLPQKQHIEIIERDFIKKSLGTKNLNSSRLKFSSILFQFFNTWMLAHKVYKVLPLTKNLKREGDFIK